MGMLGMSLEDIADGKQGWVKLPIGPRNTTMWGGREWIRIKVTAMENVRANRDIIVGNDQGEVKEHTPVELSFEKAVGGYQRVGENYPLPVDGAYAKPASIRATSSGNTEVKAPAGGKKLRIKYIEVFNSGAANVIVYLMFTTTGTAHFTKNLAVQTGFNANLIGCNWQGGVNEVLYVNLDAAVNVDVTIMYQEE